ncbi:MAG: hypothetical protein CL521_04455 [Actinobacteria bacterium]|nr:hypothetical protein [Actinomycetota bacterium]|tara:strand:- start:179 stop:604 length:426 start_codon:yes stop_codon:yes gene_type:complete
MPDNKEKNKRPQVTLKRRVTVKALVTENFKEYLRFELKENVAESQRRLDEINAQKENPISVGHYGQNAEQEKAQLEMMIQQAPSQETAISDLELDSYFVQGVIEGFVTATVGDNLYEKLGALEIKLKDGVIESINIPKPGI